MADIKRHMSDDFGGLELLVDSGASREEQCELLGRFKGHVKKTLVNEQMIGSYFDNLCGWMIASDIFDNAFLIAHSSLCYLIKRVAMQSQHKFQPNLIRMLISTLLKVSTEDKKLWQSSVKALEAVYLAKPFEFESQLLNLFPDDELRTKSLLLVDELIKIERTNGRNPLQLLQKFIPGWIQSVNAEFSFPQDDIELMYEIISHYYNEQSIKNLMTSITNKKALEIFGKHFQNNNEFFERPPSKDQVLNVQEELQNLIDSAPQFPGVPLPQAINFTTTTYLAKDLEIIALPFQSPKETEQNWRQRQANIIKLRAIILGNVSQKFPDEFLEIWKEQNILDCISKSILSLRTSLSTHGCYVVKDFCSHFNAAIDPSIIEGLWSSLSKLLSSTKKISNQNAYTCILTMLSMVPFHSRLFNNCFSLIRDKNTMARLYSSTFLRVLIIRFHKRLASQHHVFVEEWIQKALTDAQTTIRESMRITFWYWYKVSPLSGKRMLNLFPSQLRKSLETSIPSHLGIDYEPLSTASSLGAESRRSSLLPKRFPSYAAPTQSSNLPRSSIKRSLTDLATSQPSLAKRSLKTPPEQDLNIDLTSELTDSHTNPLLRRFMKKTEVEEPLDILLTNDPTRGLEALQKTLLTTQVNNTSLKEPLLSIIRSNPKSFKPLLQLSNFYHLIPLKYILLLLPLNEFDISLLDSQFSTETLLENILEVLECIESRDTEWTMFFVRHKYQIYNFCFDTIKKLATTSSVTEKLVEALFNACGKDSDALKYYSTMVHVYSFNKQFFTERLKLFPTASTKLKIANEIQKKDSAFKIKAILSSSISMEPILDSEEKNLVEMTMVNPLGKRNLSSNTVVHNPLNSDEDNDECNPESGSGKSNEYANGFTKFGGLAAITDMTKVQSVFLPPAVNENMDQIQQDNQNDITNDQKSLLSDIFSKSDAEKNGATMLKEKSQNSYQTIDYEPNLLSDAIDGMEIKTTDESNLDESDLETIKDNASKPLHRLDIVRNLDDDSLLKFELQFILSSTGTVSLGQLEDIVHSISHNGTFKMNQLHYIIKAVLVTNNEICSWLYQGGNINKVWAITTLLLSSSSSEDQMPTNIVYKSIILASCLLLIDQYENEKFLTSENLEILSENTISLLSNLDEYENEVYYMSTELRSILISENSPVLPFLLESCISELSNENETYLIKVTFILECVHLILCRIGDALSIEVLRKLTKAIARYMPSEVSEWRFASCSTLACIYNLLLSRSTPVAYIRSLMPSLDTSEFELIRSLSTKNDLTRRVS